MNITVSVKEIVDKDLWVEFCNLKGIDTYARNEGTISDSTEFTLTAEEAKELGLIQ